MTKPTSSRILLCRFGFVALCICPTLWVGSTLVYRATTERAALDPVAWQDTMTQRLGLAVEIDCISRTGSAWRLDGLRLSDPETRQLVAQATAADIELRDNAWHVQLWQPQVAAGQLPALRHALEVRLLRLPEESFTACFISASELTLTTGGQLQTLTDVECEFGIAPEIGPGLQIEFQSPALTATIPAPTRGLLHVSRNRSLEPPATLWNLETGDAPVHVALLAEFVPELAQLGAGCQFQGSATCVESPDGLRGQIAGRLIDADLDALVTEHFPHQLSGKAIVRIDAANFQAGKLIEARGSLQAEHGAISHSLLAAASEHLGLQFVSNHPVIEPGRTIPFARLTLGFHLTDRALRLAGSANPSQPGVVLDSAAGPLLCAPPNHGVPVVNLLRTLLPDNQYQVPATRETDALVRFLPMPDVVPAQIAARPAHTPTHLRTSGPPDAAPVLRPPALR